MCRHIKGVPCLFMWRQNIFTKEIEALYHCKICSKIMHYPLSKNAKEKERYERWLKQNV